LAARQELRRVHAAKRAPSAETQSARPALSNAFSEKGMGKPRFEALS
jgi:hypothetical protein